LLPALVEIMIEANDLDAARDGADELSALAARFDAPLMHALAAQARGAVLLAGGEARNALGPLRQAYTTWQELQAPHDAARVRVLIGTACRRLGDYDTARMHLEAAQSAFRRLGATPDAARLERLLVKVAPDAAGLLTAREIEVLQQVAVGKTNREIAGALTLSEKTVARHVSNILTKLGLASRSAATAYAYEHDLM
jgi:DNA-binding CsgD family transcriptional regulator